MHNQDGIKRRCLYCGQQFVPVNGSASFCCYGHSQLYNRGEVHMPEEPPAFVPQNSIFAKPGFGTAQAPFEAEGHFGTTPIILPQRLKPTSWD